MPETNYHMESRTILYQSLKREFADCHTMGSDQFIYYDPTSSKKSLAPDTFVKLGLPHKPFRFWKTWQKGAPDVGVEVVSRSDQPDEEWGDKLERYRASGIGEVVRFDPASETPIRVWDHIDGDLVERAQSPDGVIECFALGLYWVTVIHPALGKMLRLSREPAGLDLLLSNEEAEVREARARAEAERGRAEEARGRAEEARGRAEEARARAEAERARDLLAVELAELKRAQGVGKTASAGRAQRGGKASSAGRARSTEGAARPTKPKK